MYINIRLNNGEKKLYNDVADLSNRIAGILVDDNTRTDGALLECMNNIVDNIGHMLDIFDDSEY